MKTEESIVIGARIKVIRQRLGLTQTEFGSMLGNFGITDKAGESKGKSEAIVASWESGRNKAPAKVLKAIHDNVVIDGCYIRFEYLTGEDDVMLEEKRHSIRDFTTDELLAEIKRRMEAS